MCFKNNNIGTFFRRRVGYLLACDTSCKGNLCV